MTRWTAVGVPFTVVSVRGVPFVLVALAAACSDGVIGPGGDGDAARTGGVENPGRAESEAGNPTTGLGGTGSTVSTSTGDVTGNATGTGPDGTGGSGSGTGTSASSACSDDSVASIPRESIRLDDRRFEPFLRSLFPFDVDIAPALDSTVKSDQVFSTYPGANEVLANHARDMVTMAEELAMQAVDHLDEMLPCDPSDVGESECATELVQSFGSKAFRRPLTSDEVDHFLALYESVRGGSDALDFPLAIGALVQAILLSPDTLYVIERAEPSGDALVLTHYEVASRLSFLLWGTAPDDELLSLAEAGELHDGDVLLAQATRLLDDTRATAVVQRFVGEWFGTVDEIFVDHAPEELARAWEEEVRRTVEHVVAEGGTLADLLTGTQSYVNEPLAEYYGISPNPSSGAGDWQLATLPDERRGGLLTMAQFAAATSLNNSTSVIHRGKIVREKLLCNSLGTPDPSFLETDLMVPEGASVRERMDARLGTQPCGACHQLMDTIGIGMEDMDEDGLFRTEYEDGRAVDAQGELLATSIDGEFTGTVELANLLASSPEFQQCAGRQWLRYAIGRPSFGVNEACLLERVAGSVEASGGSIRDLLLAAVQSDAFIYRTPDVDTEGDQ